MSITLRPHQEEQSTLAADIVRKYGLVYLSHEPRTGKTITAMVTAKKLGARHVLFLTKKKAIASVEGDYEQLQPGYPLAVFNYEQAHNIDPAPFDLIVLDEVHSLGSFPKAGERTKEVQRICKGKAIIYLSGSPTPESFSQVYHQLSCSSYSPFKDYKTFYAWAKEYVNVVQRRFAHGLVNDYSNANQAKIEEATKHLFLSYTQQEAGFQQQVTEEVLLVKMKESTYGLVKKLQRDRLHIGKDGQEIIADTEVKLLQKTHQIFSGTVLTEDKTVICFDDSKARFIKAHFAGRKIAVFYKYRGELELLRWVFGTMITDDPQEFNSRTDLTCCLQIQSGREGVNLSTADALVMFNIDYSHVSYIQSRERLQTQQRQTACLLYWVFAEGGIEQHIYNKVMAKQDYQLSHFRKDFKVAQHAVK